MTQPIPSPQQQIALGNALPCETAPRPGPHVLVAGCGYLGRVIARQLHALGWWEVTGVTRSQASAQALQAEPFRVTACDICDPVALTALGPFDAVIHCASSGRGGPEDYRRVYLEGAQNLLATVRPTRFLFTSSTSVYAQNDGSLVTEESIAAPDRETGRILKETETVVLNAGGTVARLAGIYGPGRWALLENFLAGLAVLEGDGGRFLNHIHRDDAATAVTLLFSQTAATGIYNVSDGSPTTQLEIYTAFAAHFQRPLPPVGPPDLERKRAWTHKQVSNAKLRALGWSPRYPSFREALAAEWHSKS